MGKRVTGGCRGSVRVGYIGYTSVEVVRITGHALVEVAGIDWCRNIMRGCYTYKKRLMPWCRGSHPY